jgi:hypothetical protein
VGLNVALVKDRWDPLKGRTVSPHIFSPWSYARGIGVMHFEDQGSISHPRSDARR